LYEFVNNGEAGKVLAIYQRNYYSWQHKRKEFSTTIFKLTNKVLIELGDDYAEVLFTNNNYDYANKLIDVFAEFKAPEKEMAFEINIITQTSTGLDLKQLEIKPTALDIDMYYNDDFKPIDEIIKQRLEKENDKGIILLHGLPGTGKTTYLRHLIGSIKKRVLFVAPSVASNLMNPEFIDLLIDNPNAVVIIEDAENIIMDRKFSSNSSVSNLLNISDGLLSDCLNVQIICTFNSELHMVDSALLRKGRLIAKYEFDKLNAKKAQRLSDHLGFKNSIDKPMTIAEITNPDDMEVEKPAMQVMGFRREVVLN
jgi:SpoVK/Ycf46/Vps4 family AAA+-type ATPase